MDDIQQAVAYAKAAQRKAHKNGKRMFLGTAIAIAAQEYGVEPGAISAEIERQKKSKKKEKTKS